MSMKVSLLKQQETVERYIHLYNTFQINEMVELFTNDCIFTNFSNSSAPSECKGKEELLKLAIGSAGFFESRKQTVTNWVIAENKVAVEIDYEATFVQDLPNGLKKGQPLKMKGISIFEFESGKIKRLLDFS
jgi:steroid delta-isomerase-like uncharacterized protein